MTESLVLYTNPMSRGRIARWMLEEVGVPYRVELLDYDTSMKSPDYLAINPMGKVPAIRHGEAVVTECAAICAYLADAFPDAGLAPPVRARGDYYRWLFFTAGPLEAAVSDQLFGIEPDADQQRTLGYGSLGRVLDTLEQAIAGSRYIAGSEFSAADVYVGSQIGWGLQFGTISARDAFARYWERLSDRPAYKRATELDDAVIQESADDRQA